MRELSIPISFAALLPLFWLGICGLLAVLSGWRTLASRFPAGEDVQGERFRFVSGSMGMPLAPVNYGSCLFVTIGERGFRLAILFLFRVFSPPLFIPWTSVESVTEKRFLFIPYASIRLREIGTVISLYGRAGRRVMEAHATAQGRHPQFP